VTNAPAPATPRASRDHGSLYLGSDRVASLILDGPGPCQGCIAWVVTGYCNEWIKETRHNREMATGFGKKALGKLSRRSSTRWDYYEPGRNIRGSVRRVRPGLWNVYRGNRRLGSTTLDWAVPEAAALLTGTYGDTFNCNR
jgi:hypothetical protein